MILVMRLHQPPIGRDFLEDESLMGIGANYALRIPMVMHCKTAAETLFQRRSDRVRGFRVEDNISFVKAKTLCTGCGGCEAVCPEDAIKMRYDAGRGVYVPSLNHRQCTHCRLCVAVCPGYELDQASYSPSATKAQEHDLIGPYHSIWRSFTHCSSIRKRAASGGVITETLLHLLRSKQIDGAFLTRMHPKAALLTQTYVATSEDDILAAQGSHYCPGPTNAALKPFVEGKIKGTFAFVGLPSQVQNLRYLQMIFPHLKSQLPFVISCFTAHVPSRRATEFILFKHKISADQVQRIDYRGGDVPGRMKISLKDGSTRLVPHLHWIYSGHSFPNFFYPVREWLYFDKLSQWADFSMGDNWQKWVREPKGASTVVARSSRAEEILMELADKGTIDLEPMTAEQLVEDQHLHSKLNIRNRIRIWKMLGRTVPSYTRKFPRDPNGLLRTLRFASFIILCERRVSFILMDKIIVLDWMLRKQLPQFFKKAFHGFNK